MTTSLRIALAILTLGTTSCGSKSTGEPPPAKSESPPPARHPTSDAKPTFVAAPEGDEAVDQLVRGAMTACSSQGCELVVYVGASWCEPCTRFHDAVDAGELDQELAGLRFLEFDADSARSRLEDAGYRSRLIPLFAVPAKDGRGSSLRTEGGIKGDGAVREVMKRLGPLLARASSPAE